MVCKICKATIPDDSTFCPFCGQKVEAEAAPTPAYGAAFMRPGSLDGTDSGKTDATVSAGPAERRDTPEIRFSSSFIRTGGVSSTEEADSNVPKTDWNNYGYGTVEQKTAAEKQPEGGFCPQCGAALEAGSKFCENSGARIDDDTLDRNTKEKTAGAAKSRGLGKGVLAVIAVAAVLAIVLIVGFATNWFGASGPAAQIASAAQKTLTAENFSVEFSLAIEDSWETVEAEGTAYISVDYKKRDLMLYAELEAAGMSGDFAIYDGYSIIGTGGEYYCEDISDELDEFFDAYEEGTSKDISWEELIEDLYGDEVLEQIEDIIDLDALDSCASAYIKDLNSKKWLEENAGYSTEKEDGATLHKFKPDLYTFCKASVGRFEKAIIDEDDYDDLCDEIDNMKSELKDTDTEIVFGVKSGKLVKLSFELSGSSDSVTEGGEIRLDLEFFDIGKTKIDTEELEDMLDKAK